MANTETTRAALAVTSDSSEGNAAPKPPSELEAADIVDGEWPSSLPPEIKRVASAMFAMSRGGMGDSVAIKIAEKIEPAHIDKILDGLERDSERELKRDFRQRVQTVVCVLIGVGVLVFLVWFLAESDGQLLREIIQIGLTFAGGFGAGYGLKAYRGSQD